MVFSEGGFFHLNEYLAVSNQTGELTTHEYSKYEE